MDAHRLRQQRNNCVYINTNLHQIYIYIYIIYYTERDRLKPLPPPKPMGLAPQAGGAPMYRGDLILAPEVYNHLRGLQKKAKDLRTEVSVTKLLNSKNLQQLSCLLTKLL